MIWYSRATGRPHTDHNINYDMSDKTLAVVECFIQVPVLIRHRALKYQPCNFKVEKHAELTLQAVRDQDRQEKYYRTTVSVVVVGASQFSLTYILTEPLAPLGGLQNLNSWQGHHSYRYYTQLVPSRPPSQG